MRKFAIAVLFLAIVGAAFWFVTAPKTIDAASLAPYTPNAAIGKAMLFAGGCAACHAIPGDEDRSKLGGGLALKSPFGTFYAPNISSDPKDGIGGWTEAQFVTAMTKGTSPQGAHYYPAFPYTSYHLLALPDLRDLFAHLKTLPAVAGKVRDHDVPFPFNIRRLVGGWKFLFQAALKDWSVEDFVALLEFGDKPSGPPVVGSMVPVIRNTSQLSSEDRLAMAVYLKSLPPIQGPKRPERK
jgi:mono/diheme cytochrome c family protein